VFSRRSANRLPREGADSPTLSRTKQRVFMILTLAFPFLLFIILELGLRAFHYGPDLALFTSQNIRGRTYLTMNPQVSGRYFSQIEFNPSTSTDFFAVPKPPGTFRIFCLGGSTTVGYPYWYNAAFSSFLRDRLHAIFPERRIEVINIGMTATNSFTVLDFARDLADCEPDLLIVYDGHNEFYGALGVASRESLGSSRLAISLYLRLIHIRSFLLARDTYNRVANFFSPRGESEAPGTIMERLSRGSYIPFGSDTYRNGLTSFRENLGDLRTLCEQRHLPLILGTQVSNLRSQRPFISGNSEPVAPEKRLVFHQNLNAGLSYLMEGKNTEALRAARNAVEMDSLHAEAHFILARCLDTLGRKQEARTEYIRARDLDQLRFRTSSDFNRTISALDNGGSIAVVDMERFFAGSSRDSIVGNELIFEHLHPTARGHFTMARAFARAMRARGLLASEAEWNQRDTVDEEQLWNNRTVTELDETIARRKVEILTSGWPFAPGPPTVRMIEPYDTLGLIAEQITRNRWTWRKAHEEALAHYLRIRDDANTEREYRTIVSQNPQDIQPRLQLARFYLDRGRLEEMRTLLVGSLKIQETILAYRALGDLALRQNKFADAAGYYRHTTRFDQTDAERLENGFLLSLAFWRGGETDSADFHARRLLSINPGYPPALEMLRRIGASR
jgi:Flp pilus assembly protein TadD